MARLYSNLKFLAYGDHVNALRNQSVVAPVHIRIKPINHCNHNCWYCAYRVGDLQLGEDMNLEDRIPEAKMDEIVEDVIAMGVKAVTFSGGGEPLLYKSLPKVVTRLAEGGVKVATLTNGANLKGKMAEAFAAHGTWVRVSVDAWDDASYAKSRDIADGNFTKLIANLRNFAAYKSKCVLGISFIVGKDNCEHLFEVCELLKDVGVNHVKLSGAVVGNDVAENNRYHREIMPVVREQIERAKVLASKDFTVIDHYHELEDRFEKPYHTCPFLQFLTVIGADCQVYTCQDKAYTQKGTLGSIKDRSFREFWFSDENRERLYSLDPSRDCTHHCVSHGKNMALTEVLGLDPDHGCFV